MMMTSSSGHWIGEAHAAEVACVMPSAAAPGTRMTCMCAQPPLWAQSSRADKAIIAIVLATPCVWGGMRRLLLVEASLQLPSCALIAQQGLGPRPQQSFLHQTPQPSGSPELQVWHLQGKTHGP